VNDKGEAAAVSVSSGQGVQIGDGGIQTNVWMAKPLDPESLDRLNPRAAMDRIRQSPHNDAVDLFASASSVWLAEKLKSLLLADESRAIAILADLDPGKAAGLISLFSDDLPWLAHLPHAAEKIAMTAGWNAQRCLRGRQMGTSGSTRRGAFTGTTTVSIAARSAARLASLTSVMAAAAASSGSLRTTSSR
jgi:hypothetical protein